MFTYHGVTFAAEELIKYSRKSRTDDPLMSVEEVLAKHEKILNDWSIRHLGATVPEGNSFHEIVSGETIDGRPEIQKVLRLIESPKYKAVFCVEVQRLSRGDLEDAGRLIKLLRYTNTFVITPDMTFDLNDEYDRERFERELKRGNEYLEYYKKISWRGRLESVRDGYFISSIAPYGYDKTFILDGRKNRPTLKINESEAEVVRMIFDMYVNKDMGYVNICHALDNMGIKAPKGEFWSPAALKDMLANIHYIGKIKWNWRKTNNVVKDGEISKLRPRSKDFYIFDGKHPAIIDDELFEKAQAKLGRNHRAKPTTKVRNPLAGLVYCHCGTAMTYRTYLDKNGNERNLPRLLCNNQVHCHTSSVTYDEMIEKVVDVLESCIADFEMHISNDNRKEVAEQENTIKRLESKLEDLKRKEVVQWEKYAEEGMPKNVFDRLNEKVLSEIESLTQVIQTTIENTPNIAVYEERVCRFKNALEALKNKEVSAEQKNNLLKACIKRIEYRREKSNRYHSTPFEIDVKLNV